MRTHPLVRSLKAMFPDVEFTLKLSLDWCSMTFAGQKVMIEGIAPGWLSIDDFVETLPEHEFSIPNLLVADIAVTTLENDEGRIAILIEALVIDA